MPGVRQTLLILALAVASAVAAADTLVVEAVAKGPENSAAGLVRPKSGVSMAQVEQKFGAPATQIPQVGDPPITRWVYDHFTVYFENDRVIHSVVHRDQQQ
jgi:hypothetical protein